MQFFIAFSYTLGCFVSLLPFWHKLLVVHMFAHVLVGLGGHPCGTCVLYYFGTRAGDVPTSHHLGSVPPKSFFSS